MNKNVNFMDATGKSASELKKEIIGHLESDFGYVIVRNTNYPTGDVDVIIEKFTDFCANLGELEVHDDSAIVWHIKPRKSESKVFTFSEHNDEAPFHTDSQYRQEPENYQALYAIKKADCGGGLSSIITLKSILKVLDAHPNGKELRRIFTEIDLPFAVPTVFKKEKDNDKEVIYGKVLGDNKIRYRYDTLIKGLEFVPGILTDEQVEMITYFEKLVNEDHESESYMLQNGDILVLNNRRVMHKRSAFEDWERHLLRIRFNPINE